MKFDMPMDFFRQSFEEIMKIDSPSGYTEKVIEKLQSIVESLEYNTFKTNKGNLIVEILGQEDENIGISAHVDTLGLMVRSIKSNGTLLFTTIGGPILPTLDGEYCKIYTRCGKVYTGTILSNSPAVHVFDDARDAKRDVKNMHVKLDEIVKTADDVKKLGIMSGDFICFDPKTTITENGFIKSRFLDDKLSAAIILSAFPTFLSSFTGRLLNTPPSIN